jgi:hypothetical protein
LVTTSAARLGLPNWGTTHERPPRAVIYGAVSAFYKDVFTIGATTPSIVLPCADRRSCTRGDLPAEILPAGPRAVIPFMPQVTFLTFHKDVKTTRAA